MAFFTPLAMRRLAAGSHSGSAPPTSHVVGILILAVCFATCSCASSASVNQRAFAVGKLSLLVGAQSGRLVQIWRDPAREPREQLLVRGNLELQLEIRRRHDRVHRIGWVIARECAQRDEAAVRVTEQHQRLAGCELLRGGTRSAKVIEVDIEVLDEPALARRVTVTADVVRHAGPARVDDHVRELAVTAAVLGVAVRNEHDTFGRCRRQEHLGVETARDRGCLRWFHRSRQIAHAMTHIPICCPGVAVALASES